MINMNIEIPTHCPCCNSLLELVNEQLFCRNKLCDAQLLKRIEHFCKTMGIKGLGIKTLEKLNLNSIGELYSLDADKIAVQLGSKKIADKLIFELNQSRTASLSQVLASMSIPLVGATASAKICKVVSSINEISPETCRQAGLGDKVTSNLLDWLQTDFIEMKESLPFSFQTKNQCTSNNTVVCITGKLSSFKTKAEAYKTLTDYGFLISESVTKSTNYLVDEDDKSSTKRKKANELGIKIITNLNNFLREIDNVRKN